MQESVSVWHDRWLPRPVTFKPLSPCIDDNFSNLKEGLIKEIFLLVDVEIICALPLSRMGVEDKLLWHYDQFGRYTTKSGYHVAKSMRDSISSRGGTGESSGDSNCWARNIWMLSIPNKIKHFLWRI